MKQFYAFLESFVIVILVVAGLAGLANNFLRAGGWFDSFLDWLAPVVFTNMTASIVIGGLALVSFAWWHDRHVAKGVYNKKIPTVVLFVLMAAGVYYIGRYAILGSF